MRNPTINRLGEIFSTQSKETWQRLSYVKDSYKSRGTTGAMRFGEETITDLMNMDFYVQGSTLILFNQTPKHIEATSGTDFELWLGTDRLGWYRFAIQAKKLDQRTDRYPGLTQSNSNGPQADLLKQFANANHAAPLYCLYNYTENADMSKHWQCCNAYPNQNDLSELGCSVTSLSTIKDAIDTHGAKNFHCIHSKPNTLPWRCLVTCPTIYYSLEIMSCETQKKRFAGRSESLQPLSLFDANSCYYRKLPKDFQKDGGRTKETRRSKAGGSLRSIHHDAYFQISDEIEFAEPTDYQEPSGQLRRRSGTPKAIVVLDLESDPQFESSNPYRRQYL